MTVTAWSAQVTVAVEFEHSVSEVDRDGLNHCGIDTLSFAGALSMI